MYATQYVPFDGYKITNLVTFENDPSLEWIHASLKDKVERT